MTHPQTYFAVHTITETGKLCDGMYTCGARAATPELAKFMRGNLIRHPYKQAKLRLCLLRCDALPGTWTDSAGNAHQRYADPIVIEIEPEIGAWDPK